MDAKWKDGPGPPKLLNCFAGCGWLRCQKKSKIPSLVLKEMNLLDSWCIRCIFGVELPDSFTNECLPAIRGKSKEINTWSSGDEKE